MSFTFTSIRATTGICAAAATIAFASPSMAQGYGETTISDQEVQALPAGMQTAPLQTETTETTVGPDGVETIVRTRRIYGRTPSQTGHQPAQAYPHAAIVERDQWLEECRQRTSGLAESDKGGVIGGLLGAIAGGFIGNRVAADGDRLAGTLIGAGTGGLGGALLGNLIGGGKKDGAYNCEAALDGYLSQYGRGPAHYPAPHPSRHGYGYAQACACGYVQPQQVVYVPVRYEQQQRVVVHETVREETYLVPGAARIIEERTPPPSPKMIKQ